mgnify:CR=1 FL=1
MPDGHAHRHLRTHEVEPGGDAIGGRRLLMWNDDVEIALCRVIPGMTRSKAHQHAWEIHTTGASVVARAPKERAELFQEQLAARGLRVTIEPD